MKLLISFLFLFVWVFSARGFSQPNPTGHEVAQLLTQTNTTRQNATSQTSPSSTTPPLQNQATQTQTFTQNGTAEIPVPGTTGVGYPDLTTQAVILVFLALLPFIVMLLTSFMKMVITLSLLRSALGVQQTPPNQVINGIALLLSIYVMYPTGYQMYQKSKHVLDSGMSQELFSANTAGLIFAMIGEAKEPLRDFLVRNSKSKHIDGFYKLAMKTFPEEVKGDIAQKDFLIVIPAFITTQIKSAFEIGVLIYLPFFVIDLVTSNILLAMQMMMLSPLSISLPLKLLLLVMIDGWTILLQGLVLSFN